MDAATKDLYIRMAQMYYDQDLTQSQIAKQTGINRSTVSRILKKTRELGLVKITINADLNDLTLEQQMKEKYGLKQATVVAVDPLQPREIKLALIGRACARLLNQIAEDNDVIGFSWGSTLAEVIRALDVTTERRNMACVPLLGGPANRISSDYHVNTICYEAARKFAGQSLMIDFPAIVERPAMREAILQTDYYQDIEQMWQQISVAVFGIGSTEIAGRSTWRAFYGENAIQRLKQQGVCGDICSQFFDSNGRIISTYLSERTIAMPLERLKRLRYAIGIAESLEKVNGIRGALKGGYLNVLVTTDETAAAIIAADG
ncbi:MAG: sugar-binding transcriptional regulator [Sporolactobacillus sp.]